MSENKLNTQDKALLKAFEDTWVASHSSREALYQSDNHIELARHLLETKAKSLSTWVYIERFKDSELIELADILVQLSTHTSHVIAYAVPILLRIPKQWLMDNLDTYFEPLLGQNHGETYIAIIELYKRLDLGKAYDWSKKAANHDNADVKEVGETYLAQFRKISADL